MNFKLVKGVWVNESIEIEMVFIEWEMKFSSTAIWKSIEEKNKKF